MTLVIQLLWWQILVKVWFLGSLFVIGSVYLLIELLVLIIYLRFFTVSYWLFQDIISCQHC